VVIILMMMSEFSAYADNPEMEGVLDAMPKHEQSDQRSTGSMIETFKCETCGKLAGHPDLHQALEGLGFSDWRYTSGYIISKPAHSPPLFWHFDWGGWNHPFSYGKMPVQLFIMAYLVDTNPHNGCLRVIPKSHIQEHRLHQSMGRAHTDELRRASDLSSIEFQADPDEADVAVQAGDLVIGDARLIHGAHANRSNDRRTVITLWFFPNYGSLPESIQGYVACRFRDEPEAASVSEQIQAFGGKPIWLSGPDSDGHGGEAYLSHASEVAAAMAKAAASWG